jgi:hypothetical protein
VGPDAEQGIEGGMACPAPIEAEYELVEVVLGVGFSAVRGRRPGPSA